MVSLLVHIVGFQVWFEDSVQILHHFWFLVYVFEARGVWGVGIWGSGACSVGSALRFTSEFAAWELD